MERGVFGLVLVDWNNEDIMLFLSGAGGIVSVVARTLVVLMERASDEELLCGGGWWQLEFSRWCLDCAIDVLCLSVS